MTLYLKKIHKVSKEKSDVFGYYILHNIDKILCVVKIF